MEVCSKQIEYTDSHLDITAYDIYALFERLDASITDHAFRYVDQTEEFVYAVSSDDAQFIIELAKGKEPIDTEFSNEEIVDMMGKIYYMSDHSDGYIYLL